MLTKTSTVLLSQLTDPSHRSAWEEFDGRYRPVLLAFGRKLGLPPEDAEEATQATLTRFVEHYRLGHYDRDRGRLRSWIFSIAQNCIADVWRQKAREKAYRGESAWSGLGEAGELEQLWDAEWRQALTRRALHELTEETGTDPRTVRVFTLLTLEERSPQEVAEEMGMTTNAVYVARHRAIQRLRDILLRLEETF